MIKLATYKLRIGSQLVLFSWAQLSIVVLLARPQHIHVNPQMSSMGSGIGGRSSEAMAWMEKRIHHLKDEMYTVEARLESMRHEHTLLKAQLKDLEHLSKQQ